jgi:hypothetical protein
MTGADRIIRWSAAGAVIGVAAVVAVASYEHACARVRVHGDVISAAVVASYEHRPALVRPQSPPSVRENSFQSERKVASLAARLPRPDYGRDAVGSVNRRGPGVDSTTASCITGQRLAAVVRHDVLERSDDVNRWPGTPRSA